MDYAEIFENKTMAEEAGGLSWESYGEANHNSKVIVAHFPGLVIGLSRYTIMASDEKSQSILLLFSASSLDQLISKLQGLW
ncbi:hypothetical protein PTKIN_Ptkin01aG0129600 [Pterospermum kingtungense]